MVAIPSDPWSISNRGYWLGVTFARASLRDVETLLTTLGIYDMDKSIRNRIRVELDLLYLAKTRPLIGRLVKERMPGVAGEAIPDIAEALMQSATKFIVSLNDNNAQRDDLIEASTRYMAADRTAFLIARLETCGIGVAAEDMLGTVFSFETSIIDSTVISTLLDTFAIPQQQINNEVISFRRGLAVAKTFGFFKRLVLAARTWGRP